MSDSEVSRHRSRPGQVPAVLLGDLNMIRPLGMAKIPIILLTHQRDGVAIRSRYLAAHQLIPGYDGLNLSRSAALILELGASLHRAFGRKVPLFYSSDRDLDLIYRYRVELEAYYLFVLNDVELAWAIHDKERFYALAERAGILVPRTLRSGDDIDRRLEELREPLLVKPRRKTAWKEIQRNLFDGAGKARIFKDRFELFAHPGYQRHKDDVIVQEYLGRDVARLLSFHGFADREGRLLAWFAGRKIRTFPKFAGESCFIELIQDPAVEAAGREVLGRLGLKGPFKIDFIQDPRTLEIYTLEINARFNLWHRLGAAHGVNLPRCAYDYLVHGKSPAGAAAYVPRYKWLDFHGDVHAFREQRRRGELGLLRWLSSLADPRIIHDTFALRDPLPFVQWAAKVVRAKLA